MGDQIEIKFPPRPARRTFAALRAWLVVGAGLLILSGAAWFIKIKQPFKKIPKVPEIAITTDTVKEGQTLAAMLSAHNIETALLIQIQSNFAKSYDLRRLMPGYLYEIVTSTTGAFRSFVYHDGLTRTFTVSRSTGGVFSIYKTEQETTWREKRVTGVVTEFMYRDLLKKGFDERFVANLIQDLADNIFAWKIDFFTEQRPGDKYEVLMEQEFINGEEKPLPGGAHTRILAASYLGSGTRQKENYAFRFRQPGEKRDDFFDREGNAVRKAFLRAPFTVGNFRISSGFSNHRFHPILRIYRPHHGTDYAAPYGSHVSSIGKGHVVFAGYKGGYGNCIEIRHNSKFVSRYGHLSRIGVHLGANVSQGQYIGNVGSSGLSTGPHLHFEMIVDGVSHNFAKMDFPSASSISKENLPAFYPVRDQLLLRLTTEPTPAPAPTPLKKKRFLWF